MKNIHKNTMGFTLIELMLVISIIGILATIAVPQFRAHREKANDAAAHADAKNFLSVMIAAQQ